MSLQMRSLLTVKEVANIFNVHENTVRRWTNDGHLKAYRICKRGDRRFFLEDVSEFGIQLRQKNGFISKVRIGYREARDLLEHLE